MLEINTMTEQHKFVLGDSVLFKYAPDSGLWSALIKELDNKKAVIELDGIIVPPPNQTHRDPFTRHLLLTRKYEVYIGDLIYRLSEIGDDLMREAFSKKLQALKENRNTRNKL
jgi:hypothetical protein